MQEIKKINESDSLPNKNEHTLKISIQDKQDLNKWVAYVEKEINLNQVHEMILDFGKESEPQEASQLAMKLLSLLDHFKHLKSLTIENNLKDYALEALFQHSSLAKLEELEFMNQVHRKFSGLSIPFFNITLVNYLKSNQQLKFLRIYGEELLVKNHLVLKEILEQHPSLIYISQNLFFEPSSPLSLTYDRHLIHALNYKKSEQEWSKYQTSPIFHQDVIERLFKRFKDDLCILMFAFSEPYARQEEHRGWRKIYTRIRNQLQNWRNFSQICQVYANNVILLPKKLQVIEFAHQTLLLLQKVAFLDKTKGKQDKNDLFYLEEFYDASSSLVKMIEKKLRNNEDILSEFHEVNDWLKKFSDVEVIDLYPYQSKKYFIIQNIKVKSVTPKRLLKQFSPYSLIEQLHFISLKKEQIDSLVNNFFDTLIHLAPRDIDIFLDNLFKEMAYRQTLIKPNKEYIFQKKRKPYLRKVLQNKLQDSKNIYIHQESGNEEVNQMIQEDIDYKMMEYELNQLSLKLSECLVKAIIIMPTEEERYEKIRKVLFNFENQYSKSMLLKLEILHHNPQVTSSEKTLRYYFLLKEYQKHSVIKNLLNNCFFMDKEPLLDFQFKTCQADKTLKAMQNLAEVIKSYLQENYPTLYQFLMNEIKKRASQQPDLLIFAHAADNLLSHKNKSFFSKNSVNSIEIKKVQSLLEQLKAFHLGESSMSAVKNALEHSINDIDKPLHKFK